MKKAVAMMLAAMMAVSFTTVSFAEAVEETEAAETAELNWSDVEEYATDQLEGRFVTFDDLAVQIWIPEELQEVELTEEDVEQGFIGYYASEDESKIVSVVYVNADGISLEDYAALLAEDEDVSEIEAGLVNGLGCISYDMQKQDSTTLAFATEAGAILEVTIAPVSDEEFMEKAAFIPFSIMPEEEAE